jgi:hypothetical protein
MDLSQLRNTKGHSKNQVAIQRVAKELYLKPF